MTDTSESFAPRGSRTNPEAIADRSFSQVKRGYAEAEVRAYLRMLSSEFAASLAREHDLANRVRDLEEQLRKPALPPSDQDLIAALGEETARVLGQARESAVELRAKAEEHARRVVREAQETARELRGTTQQAVEAKTRDAEDAARSRAKEIVGEARALRERVLADLNERRQELERQITELRAGRGRLVETYELVERALTHATRVMADEPSSPPDVPPPDERADTDAPAPAPPPEEPPVASAPPTEPARAPEPAAVEEAETKEEPEPEVEVDADSEAAEAAPDVGALFEKLRSEREEEPAATDQADAPDAAPAADADGADAAVEDTAPAEAEPAATEEAAEAESTDPAIAARDEALAATADDLVRRGKRALQDEQNDLLDGLRRQRGKIDTRKVLPSLEDQIARWAHVLQPAVDAAYSAGAGTVEAGAGGGAVGSAPRALLTELATSVVSPLRERLAGSLQSIDARTPADTEIAIAQSLGARYREWRGEQLEGVLGDALAVSWSRGVFDAAPDGAQLRWVPALVGKCPDCDDNALEPTVKGSDFPTGQLHPPAHPGCRCLLVVDTG
jgi:DivIVA domain-containing protein